jgi:hypothetical protein
MPDPNPFSITVTPGGTGKLLKLVVVPFHRANVSPIATTVAGRDADTHFTQWTGTRLRSTHLLSVSPNTSVNASGLRAAAKDTNGYWSEWSELYPLPSGSSFSTGINPCSIGQASQDFTDLTLEEPAAAFPLLSLKSGQGRVSRTLVSEDFYAEQRRQKWSSTRNVFHVQFDDLEEDQTLLLQRFYRALNGSWKPFTFDFDEPGADRPTQYVVKFRDPDLAADLFIVERSSMSFVLVENLPLVSGMVA